MTTTNTTANVSTNSHNGVLLTLESTGIFLGMLVSGSILATLIIQTISKFNTLSSNIQNIKEDLETHIKAEGHERLVERFNQLSLNLQALDKKIDIHVQDYINRRDVTQMLLGQLNEKIDHKFSRVSVSIKDIEAHLHIKGCLKSERKEELE